MLRASNAEKAAPRSRSGDRPAMVKRCEMTSVNSASAWNSSTRIALGSSAIRRRSIVSSSRKSVTTLQYQSPPRPRRGQEILGGEIGLAEHEVEFAPCVVVPPTSLAGDQAVEEVDVFPNPPFHLGTCLRHSLLQEIDPSGHRNRDDPPAGDHSYEMGIIQGFSREPSEVGHGRRESGSGKDCPGGRQSACGGIPPIQPRRVVSRSIRRAIGAAISSRPTTRRHPISSRTARGSQVTASRAIWSTACLSRSL